MQIMNISYLNYFKDLCYNSIPHIISIQILYMRSTVVYITLVTLNTPFCICLWWRVYLAKKTCFTMLSCHPDLQQKLDWISGSGCE